MVETTSSSSFLSVSARLRDCLLQLNGFALDRARSPSASMREEITPCVHVAFNIPSLTSRTWPRTSSSYPPFHFSNLCRSPTSHDSTKYATLLLFWTLILSELCLFLFYFSLCPSLPLSLSLCLSLTPSSRTLSKCLFTKTLLFQAFKAKEDCPWEPRFGPLS